VRQDVPPIPIDRSRRIELSGPASRGLRVIADAYDMKVELVLERAVLEFLAQHLKEIEQIRRCSAETPSRPHPTVIDLDAQRRRRSATGLPPGAAPLA